MFSVTQFGKTLDKSRYSWDEKNKIFSTNENYLVLDFSGYGEVTFNTGSNCIFNTGHSCTFNTGHSCTFNTGHSCTFNTSSNCIFNTYSYCTFNTSDHCTFNTGYDCTFKTNHSCTFKTENNCYVIRYDVKEVTEIPFNKTIKLNEYKISGYTEIKEEIKEIEDSCNGKTVVIDGKEYILQLKEQ